MNTGSVFRRSIGLMALGAALAIAAPAQAQPDTGMSALASACQASRTTGHGQVAGYASGNDGSTWRGVISFPGALSEAQKVSVKLWVDGQLLPLQFERGNLFKTMGGPVSSPGVKSARVVCGAVPDPASVPAGPQLVNEGQGFVSAAFDIVYLPDFTFQSLTVSPAAEDGSYTIDLVMKLDHYYEAANPFQEAVWEDHSSDGWSVSQSAVKAVQIRSGGIFGEMPRHYLSAYRITVEAGGAGGPLKLTVPGAIFGPGRTEPVSMNFTAPAIATTPSYVLELPIRTSQAQPTMTFPDGSIGWIRIGRDYIGDQEEWKMENKLPGFSLETMCRIGGADQAWTGKSSGSNLWGGCGSPNAELNIEGVAMRLTGPEASKYTIAVTCDVTGSGPMTVADGVLCGPPGPGGGLQSVSATITSRP
jgi:hypothetical protein